MCLTTKAFNTRAEAREAAKNPLIAKKDIIVYKGLDKYKDTGYKSPCLKFLWEPGTHYYQTGNKQLGTSILKGWANQWRIYIEEGLYAYTKNTTVYFGNKLIKMVVPKGAKYFISNNGNEIVATEMIFPHQ